jgi:PST family polysaccharide transporter
VLVTGAGRPIVRGSRRALRQMAGFSLNAFGFQLVNYAARYFSNLLVARSLGATPAGYYALALRVMLLPVQALGLMVNRVALPVYSRLQDDRPRMRHQFLISSRMVALAAVPPMVALIVVGHDAVPLIFGDEWQDAALPIQILAFVGLQQAITSLYSSVMLACGRADWMFRYKLVTSIVLIGAFLVGVQWDLTGVCVAYAVASLAFTPFNAVLVGRLLDMRPVEYVRALVPAIVAAAVGAGAGVAAQEALQAAAAPEFVSAGAGALAVVGAFFLTLRLVWNDELREGIELAALMVRRSAPTPA